jgi:hypothetical protein
MDKRRGLKRMTASLLRHIAACQPAQLIVNERHQFIPRRFVSVAPIGKQSADFLCLWSHHAIHRVYDSSWKCGGL